ncbi:hypothetical protein T265_03328 [Opisthorchis viverrini]|uniref:Uncharacterized protein n=1 Tax=Opisthorchis viverrini TaxID=6198 RepID=A0A075AHN0_OPIVI|nr:hypothetical protein T265_03328 [Opisthorchis viverrini]KER30169.1 hypothetical protein T265_03328 [Opisthorchis viverrini]
MGVLQMQQTPSKTNGKLWNPKKLLPFESPRRLLHSRTNSSVLASNAELPTPRTETNGTAAATTTVRQISHGCTAVKHLRTDDDDDDDDGMEKLRMEIKLLQKLIQNKEMGRRTMVQIIESNDQEELRRTEGCKMG